ncbi:hypothetical protein GCM10011412_08140 [Maribacter cobaltidurans]|nr:hypothetical protein GCM10011412_08140 [Maribacter cobaltidurans]
MSEQAFDFHHADIGILWLCFFILNGIGNPKNFVTLNKTQTFYLDLQPVLNMGCFVSRPYWTFFEINTSNSRYFSFIRLKAKAAAEAANTE